MFDTDLFIYINTNSKIFVIDIILLSNVNLTNIVYKY